MLKSLLRSWLRCHWKTQCKGESAYYACDCGESISRKMPDVTQIQFPYPDATVFGEF